MGLFDFLRRPERPDMDAELERFQSTPGAVLLDVRTPEEYAAGHIPGSRNVPLDDLPRSELPEDPATPLFVCCLSGARSRQAALLLRQAGSSSVTDLGGIQHYHGKVVR